MQLTEDFKIALFQRMEREPGFREALLDEIVGCLNQNDVVIGKLMLGDFVEGTLGINQLGKLTHKSPASLNQILDPEIDSETQELFDLIDYLRKNEESHSHENNKRVREL